MGRTYPNLHRECSGTHAPFAEQAWQLLAERHVSHRRHCVSVVQTSDDALTPVGTGRGRFGTMMTVMVTRSQKIFNPSSHPSEHEGATLRSLFDPIEPSRDIGFSEWG